jgi:hypothetical protein
MLPARNLASLAAWRAGPMSAILAAPGSLPGWLTENRTGKDGLVAGDNGSSAAFNWLSSVSVACAAA